MNKLTDNNMVTLIPPWATTDTPYTYDFVPTSCVLSIYDSLHDYDATEYTISITSITTVTTMFHGDAGFANNGGIIEDTPGDHEWNTAGFVMSLFGYRYGHPYLDQRDELRAHRKL